MKLLPDIWNESNGPCDFCMLPDCPGISECGVLNKVEADVVRFNQYAEMFSAPKLLPDYLKNPWEDAANQHGGKRRQRERE
jgi:hypothetical protein